MHRLEQLAGYSIPVHLYRIEETLAYILKEMKNMATIQDVHAAATAAEEAMAKAVTAIQALIAVAPNPEELQTIVDGLTAGSATLTTAIPPTT
jgi:hypothetical protein